VALVASCGTTTCTALRWTSNSVGVRPEISPSRRVGHQPKPARREVDDVVVLDEAAVLEQPRDADVVA
jgi:hypothetical protein